MLLRRTGLTPKVTKAALLMLSVMLAASAFVGRGDTHIPRRLALVGSSLVALAGVARRHFAEDSDL
jgi:hypothetical protein